MKATAIVLAAGKGQRMGSEIPKQYLDLAGKPVLSYCLGTFEKSRVEDVIIVAGAGDLEMIRSRIVQPFGFSKVKAVIEGGKERYDSVLAGLRYLSETNRPDSVLIHDGARPFLSGKVLDQMLAYLEENEAVIAGMPVKDTIKLVDADGRIQTSTDRKLTWLAQTPQAFRFERIFTAYQNVIGAEQAADRTKITDDAMVFSLQYPDLPVKMMEAGYQNLKITTPEDLQIAEILAKKIF